MKQLRICHSIFSNPWHPRSGGGHRAVDSLSSGMSELGHDVITLYSGKVNAPTTYRVISLPPMWKISYCFEAVSHAIALKKILSRERIDLVIGHSVNAAFFPSVCRKFGVPFVFLFHGRWLPKPWIESSISERAKFFDYHLVSFVLSDADNVAVFSRWSHDYVLAQTGRTKSAPFIIQPGIDACWRVDWKPTNSRTIIFWGRVVQDKGLDELLDSFAIVRRQLVDTKLLIVGSGQNEGRYRAKALALGVEKDVVWVGRKDATDIAKLALSCAVSVFPSHQESYGFTVLEAMTMGMPIVCTSAGSLPEVVEGYGQVKIVAPQDSAALAEAIIEQIVGQSKGHSTFRRQPTWRDSAQALLNFAGES